ncbi:hypothetical protein SAMN05444920_1021020 [Nonomuraea solani]|uniref:Hydrolase of the HAD superfamily n=1 Tax=Nonomuraea solani TaxID=1144553 RepID=A0A1H6A3Y8_9ACTN|nr:hypothetical protein [Nonomuraea solani]SEG43449.1 hypothetical protein SAMN05444920_1021020 [Nonomuraea solani]
MLALFDLDNTLIDRLAAFKRWAADHVVTDVVAAIGHILDESARRGPIA